MAARTIAFATCRSRPEITDDDALVSEHLPAGVRLVGVPWDDEDRDWARLDAVVLRSTWDYHRRRSEFEGWLERLTAGGARTWNPVETVRWNLDKTYLRDLEDRGVEVTPTLWLERGERIELRSALASRAWRRAVVKPTVGASSFGLFVVEGESAGRRQRELDALLERGGAMIQPLIEEVGSDGEWSLIFFSGELSHAILKRPRDGEVRVQSEFGGSIEGVVPPPVLAAWAAACLRAAAADTLYARVDAVVTARGPLLMELELIEPQLFLEAAEGAAARFARALVAALAGLADPTGGPAAS